MDEVQSASVTAESYSHDDHIFVPSSFFPTSQPTNSLNSMYGMKAINQGLWPSGTAYFVPRSPSVTVDWTCPGWFCIHEFPFRIGLTFPCSSLAKDLLMSLGVSPCQLMSCMWKMVFAVEVLGREHGCPLLISDLKNVYSIRGHGRRFSFRVRKNCSNLILGLDNGDDKGWNTCFLFLRRDSLGAECEFIPCELQSKISSWMENLEDKESEARVKRFLSIPAFDRTWPLVSIPLFPSGQVEPKVEGIKSVVPASPSLPAGSSRSSLKVEDVLARAKLKGLKLPISRKVIPSKMTITAQDVVSGNQVSETPSGDKNNVADPQVDSGDKDKVEVAKESPCSWAEEESIIGLKRKRVVKVSKLASCNFDGMPMSEGHKLLDEISQVEQEDFDLSQLTVKMVACTSQAFQCALAIGHGYKGTISSLEQTIAANKNLNKKMGLLLSSGVEQKEKLETLRFTIDELKSEITAQELKVEGFAADHQKNEIHLERSYAICRELQLENKD